MYNNCLRSTTAFKNKYCNNNKISNAILSSVLGSLSAGSIIGCAVIYAMFSVPTFLGFSYGAKDHTQNAIIIILPIAISIGLGIATLLYYNLNKIKKNYQKTANINSLAAIVGEIIFLPMFAKINEKLLKDSNFEEEAKKKATKTIYDWGYTDEFTKTLIDENIGKKTPEMLLEEFDNILKDINKLNEKVLYKNSCLKIELPTKAIAEIAKSIAKKI